MNTLNFSKSSWHYRLVCLNKYERDISTNFCGYFWDVVLSMMVMGVAFGATILISYALIVSPLMYFAVVLQYGAFEAPSEVRLGILLDLLLISFTVLYVIFNAVESAYFNIRYVNRETPKVPGFVSTAWKTFRDKTCFKIEFHDKI